MNQSIPENKPSTHYQTIKPHELLSALDNTAGNFITITFKRFFGGALNLLLGEGLKHCEELRISCGLVPVFVGFGLVGWAIVGTAEAQRSKLLFEHPFIHAARNGDLAAVRYMIARGDTRKFEIMSAKRR